METEDELVWSKSCGQFEVRAVKVAMKSGPGGSESVAMAYEVSRERPTQNTWLAVLNSRQTILLPDRVILGSD